MEYWAVSYSSDSIKHYGVLGMRWGVRHDPQKAYHKSAKKLAKLDRIADKNARKASSKLKYKAAKLESKSAKYERKAAKLGVKAAKADRKVLKIRKASTRRFLPMNADKAAKKIAKYSIKADRARNRVIYAKDKAASTGLSAAKLKAKYAKFSAKSEKYNYKSDKWLKQMNKAFADVPVSSLNKEDVQMVNDYINRHRGLNR